jgi:hypothetical protein
MSAVMERTLSLHRFAPDWGAYRHRLWDLVSAATDGSLMQVLDEALDSTTQLSMAEVPLDLAKLQFSLSVLRDVLRAGGKVRVRDSQLHVSWPAWEAPEGRALVRAALNQAREMRALSQQELDRVRPLLCGEITGDAFSQVLAEGEFHLVPAAEKHPSGISYGEAFSAALRYWSMPYRGRTGRMQRFVITASHPLLGKDPIVAGIIELGDEAPFCRWRDELLGLDVGSFKRWLQSDRQHRAKLATKRLRNIRFCLKGVDQFDDLNSATADDLLSRQIELERAAHGRSLVSDADLEDLKNRKRIIYAVRLARGERALVAMEKGQTYTALESDLMAGVRALHDLLLPRLHMEATVCGALPPFSQAFGGKLVVSFLSSPQILNATKKIEGELLGWSFDMKKLDKHLPAFGMLCLTTKGLYPGHAPLYNRATAPGKISAVQMKHLDNTGGATTTLMSQLTTQLARRVLEAGRIDDTHRVSNVYGSGGAKRHRAIEAACMACGLPQRLVMADIRRPVYGMEFVENAKSVSWLGDSPDWRVDRNIDEGEFSMRAVDLWRCRWLRRAQDRAQEFALMPSAFEILKGGQIDG